MTQKCFKLCLLAMGLAVSSCATISTSKADLNEAPDGVRVYAPKVYLFVDGTSKKSRLEVLPDYDRAYDVKPVTILAKHDFKIELDDGRLKSLAANQDTTALLTFLGGVVEEAAGIAGAVSGVSIDGTFGLAEGIYVMGDDGVFRPASAK